MARPEDLLHDALEHRAARTTWDPTPASTVVRRAGRARRRRRLAAVAGAAVLVVAVAVPVSLLGSSDVEVAPAIAVDSASAPPTIGYAVDDVYRYPAGGLVRLPAGTTSITPVDDGLLVTDDPGPGGSLLLQRVSPRGVAGPPTATTGTPVVAPGRTVAAILTEPEGDRPVFAPVLRVEQPDTASRERSVVAGALLLGVDDDGTVAFLHDRGRQVAVLGPDQVAVSGTPVPGVDVVQDYSSTTHLLSDVRADADGGGVVDDDGTRLWDRDGTLPSTFSPDGTRLLAVTGDDLEVRDARTGELLLALSGAAGPGSATELRDVVWEDDAHLLASRAVDGGRELVRVGLDGTTTPLTVPDLPDDADLVWDTRP